MVAGSPGPIGRLPQAGTAISLLPESAGTLGYNSSADRSIEELSATSLNL